MNSSRDDIASPKDGIVSSGPQLPSADDIVSPKEDDIASSGPKSPSVDNIVPPKSPSQEFTDKVILVQSVQAESAMNFLLSDSKFEAIVAKVFSEGLDPSEAVFEQTERFMKNDGTIASHLDFNTHQYSCQFVDRPHSHWTWNGLVQANSGGDWEGAKIAYLEPLSAFEHVYGCTPFDTMVVGAHKLSNRSIIIVPEHMVSPLTKKLDTYQGKIIGYDPKKQTLRQAIANIISTAYPQAFKLMNKHKKEVGEIVVSDGSRNIDSSLCSQHDYNHQCGYFKRYYVQNSDDESSEEELMDSPGTIRLKAYNEYMNGRHVGLHHSSATDIENNAVFKKLKAVSEKPDSEIAKNMDVLIGAKGQKNPAQLLSVAAFRKYEELHQFDQSTGTHKYAVYLVKKAITADLRSIHKEMNIEIPLQEQDIKAIIEGNFKEFMDALGILVKSKSQPDLLIYRGLLQNACLKALRIEMPSAPAQPASQQNTLAVRTQPAPQQGVAPVARLSTSRSGFWSRNTALAIGGGLIVGGVIGCAIYFSRRNN